MLSRKILCAKAENLIYIFESLQSDKATLQEYVTACNVVGGYIYTYLN